MDLTQLRNNLIDHYLSTGKVGFTKPKDDIEAIKLIETVLTMYKDEEPKPIPLKELTNKMKNILD